MTKMERCEKAMKAHESGLNCAQAVLAAFEDVTGLTEAAYMALAGGFGGGMSCGNICGVVSGGVMVLGAARPHTRENGAEGKQRAKKLAQEYQRRFTEQFRHLNCRELLADQELEGTAAARALGVTHHCRMLVVSGVELLCDMLAELEAQ